VNRAGDQLFTGPCFALDENRGIGRGNLLDLFEHRFESSAVAYDLLESARYSVLIDGPECCDSCHEGPPTARYMLLFAA
jgi:hypothetical protein